MYKVEAPFHLRLHGRRAWCIRFEPVGSAGVVAEVVVKAVASSEAATSAKATTTAKATTAAKTL